MSKETFPQAEVGRLVPIDDLMYKVVDLPIAIGDLVWDETTHNINVCLNMFKDGDVVMKYQDDKETDLFNNPAERYQKLEFVAIVHKALINNGFASFYPENADELRPGIEYFRKYIGNGDYLIAEVDKKENVLQSVKYGNGDNVVALSLINNILKLELFMGIMMKNIIITKEPLKKPDRPRTKPMI